MSSSRTSASRIAEGNVTALVGPSGGGKSTLLRCINLLEIPTAGTIRLGEETDDFQARPEDQLAGHPEDAPPDRHGVPEFPALPAPDGDRKRHGGLVTVLKWPKERARDRAMELLTKVGMAHKADAWPATLSGGQQQRVAIARALAPSPRVLLCDEPTSALDPELAAEVVEVLGRLASEGTTMVMATHDLRLASKIANDVVFLEAGSVVETGSAVTSSPRRNASAPSASSRRSMRRIATIFEKIGGCPACIDMKKAAREPPFSVHLLLIIPHRSPAGPWRRSGRRP
jgi:cystine transport system ATP-binding protein